MSVAKSKKSKNSSDPSGEFADELKPGTKLLQGQYVIDSFLNSGGFGITYLARDSLDRRIVIKECFPGAFCRRSNTIVGARSRAHQNEFASIVKLFVQEAKSLAKIVHPNIVGVHQVFEDNDTAYMAIDYVDGLDMAQIVEEKKMNYTPESIQYMLRKLLDAVGFIHDHGMLHRDISPDNILINQDEEPILIDFGAARKQSTTTGRALSALRVVKDGYSPQEFYVTGAVQNESSDLYALSASFYHLISGDVPADSQTRLAAIAERRPDPYLPLAGRIKGYPQEFLQALDAAINVLPKTRLQSTAEWLARIDGNAKASPKAGKTAAAPARKGGPSKTAVLLGSVAVAAAAAAAFVVLQPVQTDGTFDPDLTLSDAAVETTTLEEPVANTGATVVQEDAALPFADPDAEKGIVTVDGRAQDAADDNNSVQIAAVDQEVKDPAVDPSVTPVDATTELDGATSDLSDEIALLDGEKIEDVASTDVAGEMEFEVPTSPVTEVLQSDTEPAGVETAETEAPADVADSASTEVAEAPSDTGDEMDIAVVQDQIEETSNSVEETGATTEQTIDTGEDTALQSDGVQPDADATTTASVVDGAILEPIPVPEPEPEPAPVLQEAIVAQPVSVWARVVDMILPVVSSLPEQPENIEMMPPAQVTEPARVPATDVPAVMALTIPVIEPEPAPESIPEPIEPVAETVVADSDATTDSVPSVPEVPLAKNQIVYTGWGLDIPFVVSYRSIDGSGVALITGLDAQSATAELNAWAKRGVAIFLVDGQEVSQDVPVETLVARTAELESSSLIEVPVRIKSALNRKFEQRDLIVSVQKTIHLKQGVTLVATFEDGKWQTKVADVDGGSGQTLQTGDILLAEATSGQAISASDSVETILAMLVESETQTALFDILRNGENQEVVFALAKDR